jgi:hypothetical protein
MRQILSGAAWRRSAANMFVAEAEHVAQFMPQNRSHQLNMYGRFNKFQ